MSKNMIPLCSGGVYNSAKQKCRVDSLGVVSFFHKYYPLWTRSAIKEDYPINEMDVDYVMVEVLGVLIDLNMTRYDIACAITVLNSKYRDEFRNIKNSEDYEKRIAEVWNDEEAVVGYIDYFFDSRVAAQKYAIEHEGVYPDIIGAFILQDIPTYFRLKAICDRREQEEELRRIRENEKYVIEVNAEYEKELMEAEEIIRNGGLLKNKTIQYAVMNGADYSTSDYKVIMRLMDRFNVDVANSTKHWIKTKLIDAKIKDGECVEIRYDRTTRNKFESDTIWRCFRDLIKNVNESTPSVSN